MEQPQTEEGFVSFDSNQEDETPAEIVPDIDALSAALAERDTALERLAGERDSALAAYRQAMAELNPELPDELITGATVAEVEQALVRARALVERVKAGLKPLVPPSPVAVPRSASSEALSPEAKIRRGLNL